MSAAEASPLPTLASSNVITPNNHGAYVTITALLMLVSMVLLTGLRLSIRFPFRQLFGIDDTAIVISAVKSRQSLSRSTPINQHFTHAIRQICATAQTGVTIQAVKFGLGRHAFDLTDYQRDTAQKVAYTRNPRMKVLMQASAHLRRQRPFRDLSQFQQDRDLFVNVTPHTRT